MKAKLIEVGRNNVSKEVEVKDFYELENEVRNVGGIVSRSMELVESSGGKYDVIVGMGSKVGESEVFADTEEGYNHFYTNHKPEAWDYGDI